MELEVLDITRTLGKSVGRKLHRVILDNDGRVEVEFEAPNPWECFVIKAVSWMELLALFENDQNTLRLTQEVVIRNKCEKCLLQERKVEPAELRCQQCD